MRLKFSDPRVQAALDEMEKSQGKFRSEMTQILKRLEDLRKIRCGIDILPEGDFWEGRPLEPEPEPTLEDPYTEVWGIVGVIGLSDVELLGFPALTEALRKFEGKEVRIEITSKEFIDEILEDW